MRFGVALPTYPAGATVDGVVDVAKAAERLGFHSAWTTDHVILPADHRGPYREIFEPLMMLAYLAPYMERIQLGISVIVVPQRNGIVLAKQLATLDHLCQGRLIVGVGAGWSHDEFQMLDAGDRFHRRGAYLDETIDVWCHLWSDPEREFRGHFYDLSATAFGPLPYVEGGPPIWVGGSSAPARRRTGRYGAAWHPVGISAADLAENAELVYETARQHGRDRPKLAPRLPMRFGGEAAEQMTANPTQVLQGEPDQMIELLKEYEDAGASEIICTFGSPDSSYVIEQMEQLHSEVMPAFRTRSRSQHSGAS